MRILTYLRQVLDAEESVHVANSEVALENSKLVMDTMDEYGVEEALRLRESSAAAGGAVEAEIVAVAVGPARTQDALRTALAMGVDRAIHVETDVRLDAIALSKVLAEIAKKEDASLILSGGQQADWDSHALGAATATLVALNHARLTDLRASMDAGANASVLPIFSVASLVGFGAVVAALPAFALVRDWVLSISGGPLVSLAIATNVLAAFTGSASGGLTIALDALGDTYLEIARTSGIDPALMHRIAVIGSGTLDSLPHNGAVVTLLAVCGSTHRNSYFDMVMANIVGPLIALVVVIALGSLLGSF